MNAKVPPVEPEKLTPLIELEWNNADWLFSLTVSVWVALAIVVITVAPVRRKEAT